VSGDQAVLLATLADPLVHIRLFMSESFLSNVIFNIPFKLSNTSVKRAHGQHYIVFPLVARGLRILLYFA